MSEGERLDPLQSYCRSLGVTTRISPGLDPRGPTPAGAGTPRYALGGELGRGGFGRVLLGVDRNLRRGVALKLLGEERARDPKVLQAFVEEAIVTGGLEHPNIAPAYELGYSPELGPYFAMKRVSGRALDRVLAGLRDGDAETVARWSLLRLLGVFVEVCRAIAYAHSRGVLHTDLKPSNVMIGDFGEVVVVDWGLAQIQGPVGAEQARAQMSAGTPQYMAPEQASSKSTELDARADVWSLGAILYEILCGVVPFDGTTSMAVMIRLVTEDAVPPSQRAPDRGVPPELERICLRALARHRDQRTRAVPDLLADVEAWIEGRREQLRRDELARDALEAHRRLAAMAEGDEQALMDAELADADAATLAHLRGRLLERYEASAVWLQRALAGGGDPVRVGDAMGEVYWRAFEHVHPGRRPADPGSRDRAAQLLQSLSASALSGVVRAGATSHAAPNEAPSDDPWLVAVSSLLGRAEPSFGAPTPMRDLFERIRALRAQPLFASLAASELLPIAEACEHRAVAAGERLAEQDAPGDAIFFVVSGAIEARLDGEPINVMGPGEVIGEIAAIAGTARTASLVARAPSVCLVLGAADFRALVRGSGAVGLSVIDALIDRLLTATDRELALRRSQTTTTEPLS